MRRHAQPGHMIYDTAWMVSVAMVTCFLQIALTMSSVAMVADENMYAGFFFMRNIKNWIISVSMVTSEYRRGKRALYFAIDPRLYLKDHDILREKGMFKVDQVWTQCNKCMGERRWLWLLIVSLISLVSGPFHFSTAKKVNLGALRKVDCAFVCLFYAHKCKSDEVSVGWFNFRQSDLIQSSEWIFF